MICEPNLSLPQKIDLQSLMKTEYGNNSTKISNNQKPLLYAEEEYKILPKLMGQFDHLNPILSLHKNYYLACRWNQFLDNSSNKYVRIQLYKDHIKEKKKLPLKNKILNGNAYDWNNKLAPVPVDHPDNLIRKEVRSYKKI